MRILVALIICLISSTALMANPLKDLSLVGQAKLEVFFFDIYHSELYSASGGYQENTFPLGLKLTYLRDIEAQSLVNNSEKEWKKQGFKEDSYGPWLASIQHLFPDIKKGDEIVLLVDDNQQSHFYYNQDPLQSITDPSFGPGFLAIWLSEKCSYPKVRNKLIGNTK